MLTILSVIPSLDYGGAAGQLALLAHALPRASFRHVVCVFVGDSPWSRALQDDGVPVHSLDWTRPIDVRPLLRLAKFYREVKPAVVHAWGLPALRALAAAGVRPSRIVFSDSTFPPRKPRWADRRVLRRCGAVFTVPPVVDPTWPPPSETPLDLVPADGRVLLGVGPLKRRKGFRDAVWAFDILNFVYGDLRLVMVGGGPDLGAVKAFADVTAGGGRIHFIPGVEDLRPLLRRATLLWSPGSGGGRGAVLDALAAGLPVIGTRRPALAGVVDDGVTGVLTAPDDPAGLARVTRALLDDPSRLQSLAAAGRLRAAEEFSPGRLAEECGRVYEAVAARVLP